MFLTKNLLIALGSVGVLGGGGYMIYNATKSSDSEKVSQPEAPNVTPPSPVSESK